MPGGTDFTGVSQRKLIQLARRLNDQPRKCLNYKASAEELAGQRATRLSGTGPSCDRQRPALQLCPFDRSRPDDIGRLVERGAHTAITDL